MKQARLIVQISSPLEDPRGNRHQNARRSVWDRPPFLCKISAKSVQKSLRICPEQTANLISPCYRGGDNEKPLANRITAAVMPQVCMLVLPEVSNCTTPIFGLDLHFGPDYTPAKFHVCNFNGCNIIILTRRFSLSGTNKHTNKTPAKIQFTTTYMVVHTTKYISSDTHKK